MFPLAIPVRGGPTRTDPNVPATAIVSPSPLISTAAIDSPSINCSSSVLPITIHFLPPSLDRNKDPALLAATAVGPSTPNWAVVIQSSTGAAGNSNPKSLHHPL